MAIKGFPSFLISFVEEIGSIVTTGSTDDTNNINGPLKRLIAFTKSKVSLYLIELLSMKMLKILAIYHFLDNFGNVRL